MKNQLSQHIISALHKLYPVLDTEQIAIHFQVPKDKGNGDLSTNIAMQLAKKLQVTPIEIANQIVFELTDLSYISHIAVAGAGFLNFYLQQEAIFSSLNQMIEEGAAYGQASFNGIYINLEYVSVNPTGDLHVGHARGAVYGDVIARLLKKSGYDVTKEYYINDAGNQITKLGQSTDIRYRQLLGEDIEMIEDGYHAEDIIDIAKKLVVDQQVKIEQLPVDKRQAFFAEYALKEELDKIAKDLSLLAIEHDVWFSERTLYQTTEITDALAEMNKRGMLYEQDGATWLKSTDFGDDKDRVLVKSDGTYTYLTPDIGYHVNKLRRLAGEPKFLIDILGGDHHGYVARMKAALQTLGYDKDILDVKLIQMVRFIQDGTEVKMSKRTGNAIAMRELVEEVGVDAVRYFFSMRSCDTPLDFDMTLATEQSNNNPVYYAQYAHARICSILRKAQVHALAEDMILDADCSLLTHEKDRALANKLNQYHDVIQMAALRKEPFKVTNFIQELAAQFHSFYNATKVIDSDNIPLTCQRLKLVKATQAVLQSAFEIIGITALEQM